MARWSDKDPAAITTRAIDLERAIRGLDPSDTLAAVAWSATPAGLTVSDAGVEGFVASVGLEDGADRTRYLVTCTYTTGNGRTDRWTEPLFVVRS